MNLWVIIPAYNEAGSIEATLRALRAQDDRDFTLLVVDNASTDDTAEVVRRHGVQVISEPRKGTGAASDTGVRHAIAAGATHIARTDADCLPRPDWVRNIRRAFGDGLEMVGGRLRPRTDEFPLKFWERRFIPLVVQVAATFGRFRPGNRDPLYKGPYVMMPGCTLAITAGLYERAGASRGPRSRRSTRTAPWSTGSGRSPRRTAPAATWSSTARCGGCGPTAWRARWPGTPTTATAPTWSTCDELRPARRAVLPFVFRALQALRALPAGPAGPRGPALPGRASSRLPADPPAGRLGPVVRVPGLGVVVNDAAVARAVLTDERFRKDGPGSPGDLWTPVLGPSVLLNMEGPDHLALRRKLMPLFTPAYVSGLVADVLREPLEALDARLARGETVDLVDTMRVMAGAVICRTIGLGEVPEARARELFAEGERVVSMVSLRSRRLSDRQVVIARRVLDRIGDIAQAAYEAGDESTIMGRMRAQGLSAAEARGRPGPSS
nr:hypothetical protein GCM10020093_074570 [Planobispora longispora]